MPVAGSSYGQGDYGTGPYGIGVAFVSDLEVAALRRLTSTDTAKLPDAEATRLLRAHRCTCGQHAVTGGYTPDPYGQPVIDVSDPYGAAAEWWETASLAATTADVRDSTSERNGDVSVTRAARTQSRPAELLAVANRMRRRSCPARVKVARLLGDSATAPTYRQDLQLLGAVEYVTPRLAGPGDVIVNR